MKITQKDILDITEQYKNKTKKKCYKIMLYDKEPEILDDKLGGKPYLPVGEKYPTDKDGRPMPLLLQINLKNISLKDFPKQGILEVFTNMAYPMEYCIKLFDEGLEYQTDLPDAKAFYEDEECEYFVKRPICITLEKDIIHMPSTNYRHYRLLKQLIKQHLSQKTTPEQADEFVKNYENVDKIWEQIEPHLTYAPLNIGGYPNFCQYDPRPDLKPRKNECIFSIDCVGVEEFVEIYDSGIIWGFISKEDLKNQNFCQAFVDCDFC